MSSFTRAVLPSLDHISIDDEQFVYSPSDDTFLLCDALEADRLIYFKESRPVDVLEIGCGSGCVITFIALLLRQQGILSTCYACDISHHALAVTKRTAAANQVSIELIRSDLAGNLHPVDLVIFNPPYVPTPDDELNSLGIQAAWAGGRDGRFVIDRFVSKLNELLRPGGRCYLVLVEENKPRELMHMLTKRWAFACQIVLSRQAQNEKLHILCIDKREGSV